MTTEKLHLIDSGPRNGPVLVLLHSIATSAAMWQPQITALSGRFRIIAPDLPGHGASPIPEGEPDVAGYASAVMAALAPLRLKPAIFVGLSFGSMIAQVIGAHHSRHVAGLVLSNGVAYAPPAVRSAWMDRIADAERHGMASQVEPTLARWFTPEFLASDTQASAGSVARIGKLIAETPVAGYCQASHAIAALDNRALLGAIAAPTLVVAGERDTAAPTEAVSAIATAVSGARYQALPGAHLINVEHPETYSRLLIDFADGIGTGLAPGRCGEID